MVKVVNAVGTSDEKCPSWCTDWLDYWNRMTGKSAAYCRHCHERTSDLCGGHVQKVESTLTELKKLPGLYITPICRDCNNYKNKEVFSVSEDDLVKV